MKVVSPILNINNSNYNALFILKGNLFKTLYLRRFCYTLSRQECNDIVAINCYRRTTKVFKKIPIRYKNIGQIVFKYLLLLKKKN